MKKEIIFCIMITLFFSCCKSPQEKLLGKWKCTMRFYDGEKETDVPDISLEFLNKDSYIHKGTLEDTGKYTFLNDSLICHASDKFMKGMDIHLYGRLVFNGKDRFESITYEKSLRYFFKRE